MWVACARRAVVPACSSAGSADPTGRRRQLRPGRPRSRSGAVKPSPSRRRRSQRASPASMRRTRSAAAWAAYAGTLQALGVAASFGGLPSDQFAALELAAAPRLVEVAAAIDASWPSELAGERNGGARRSGSVRTRDGREPWRRCAARLPVSRLTSSITLSVDVASRHLSVVTPSDSDRTVPPLPAGSQAKIDAAAAAYDSARHAVRPGPQPAWSKASRPRRPTPTWSPTAPTSRRAASAMRCDV